MHITEIIKGKWVGNYRYLHERYQNKVGQFEIQIYQFTNDNQFSGKSFDTTEHITGEVRGTFNDPEIKFTKRYDITEFKIGNETVRLAEEREIIHVGELVDTDKFYGTWFRREKRVRYNGGEYSLPAEQGSWSVIIHPTL